jgi:hypothetical protein
VGVKFIMALRMILDIAFLDGTVMSFEQPGRDHSAPREDLIGAAVCNRAPSRGICEGSERWRPVCVAVPLDADHSAKRDGRQQIKLRAELRRCPIATQA